MKFDAVSTCTIVCWAGSALAGLGVLIWVSAPTGFFAALLAGAALAVLLGVVATRLFCDMTGAAQAPQRQMQAPAATDRPATPPAAKAEPAQTATAAAPMAGAAMPEEGAEAPPVSRTESEAQPAGLDAPRGGAPDDLKQIKGVGPKLEKLLHEQGIFHFDQIAGWSAAEVAWIDQNLKGFKGRVSRDEWVRQAEVLAAGGNTEFSRRVEDGDVY